MVKVDTWAVQNVAEELVQELEGTHPGFTAQAAATRIPITRNIPAQLRP